MQSSTSASAVEELVRQRGGKRARCLPLRAPSAPAVMLPRSPACLFSSVGAPWSLPAGLKCGPGREHRAQRVRGARRTCKHGGACNVCGTPSAASDWRKNRSGPSSQEKSRVVRGASAVDSAKRASSDVATGGYAPVDMHPLVVSPSCKTEKNTQQRQVRHKKLRQREAHGDQCRYSACTRCISIVPGECGSRASPERGR